MTVFPRWNAPEVNFLEVDSLTIQNRIIQAVEEALGRELGAGDPVRMLTLTFANEIINLSNAINISAQQQTLPYAQGTYLDYFGVPLNCPRLEASSAVCTVEIKLSTTFETARIVPLGTEVTDGVNIFAAQEEVVFAPGETTKEVYAQATTPGASGNGIPAGQLNIQVEPLPYVASMVNITRTSGGAEAEDDETYAERLHLITDSITTAGPRVSYIFHARSVTAAIGDVEVFTPSPGVVQVYVLMRDGELPTETILEMVEDHLSAEDIRPLGDKVEVLGPTIRPYNVKGGYYVDRSKVGQGQGIQDACSLALQEYLLWQKSKIGRDLTPDKLISLLVEAGAKRVILEEPQFTVLEPRELAQEAEVELNFLGFEEE